MKKTILALALAAGLTSFAESAKANLIFNWTMTGDPEQNNSPSDTIGGLLTLNEAGTAAISAILTYDIGGHEPVTAEDYVANAWAVRANSFTVVNGNITSADLEVYTPIAMLALSHGPYNIFAIQGGSQLVNIKGDEGVTFTPVTGGAATAAVPEPSQVAASLLLAAGVAGFVIVKRRKEASELEALAA